MSYTIDNWINDLTIAMVEKDIDSIARLAECMPATEDTQKSAHAMALVEQSLNLLEEQRNKLKEQINNIKNIKKYVNYQGAI